MTTYYETQPFPDKCPLCGAKTVHHSETSKTLTHRRSCNWRKDLNWRKDPNGAGEQPKVRNIERIGGLPNLRHHMELEAQQAAELHAEEEVWYSELAEASLSEAELQAKYDPPRQWGQHPTLTMEHWRSEVADQDTRMGYWSWVKYKLNE